MDATSNNDQRKAADAPKLSLHAPTQAAFLSKVSSQTGLPLQSTAEELTLGGDLHTTLTSVALAALPFPLRSRRVNGPQVVDVPPPVATEEDLRVGHAVLEVTTLVDLATTSDDGAPLDAEALEEGLRGLPAARGTVAKARLRGILGVAPHVYHSKRMMSCLG